MATSLEITQAILIKLLSQIQSATDEKVLQILLDEYEQITEMIRDGYQFSDEDLKSLPDLIKADIQELIMFDVQVLIDSQVFDFADYEEGVWNCNELISGTPKQKYVRVGNLVTLFFDGSVTFDSHALTGIPFPSSVAVPASVYFSGVAFGSNLIPDLLLSNSTIYLRLLNTITGDYSDFTDLSGTFRFSVSYIV